MGGVILIMTLLPSATTTEASFTNDPDSTVALDLIEERFEPIHIDEVAVVRSEQFTVDASEFEALVQQYTTAVGELGGDVIHHAAGRPVIADFYETGIDLFVSADRHTTIVTMTLAGGLAEASKNVGRLFRLARI